MAAANEAKSDEMLRGLEHNMTADEQTIVLFLKGSPESYFARREIARRAVKRQLYEENPHWVDAPLAGLVDRGVVEKNDNGQYRLKQLDPSA